MASTTSFPPGPLRVENVGVSAGGTRILKKVDLTLHPGELLLSARIDERELILYFQRDSLDDPWYMRLEDSLRQRDS